MAQDLMRGFLFSDMDIRGVHIRLDKSMQTLLQQHDYPPAVSSLLSQLFIASALLSANLKLQGRLSVQVRGDGPLEYAMAECRLEQPGTLEPLSLKGLARHAPDVSDDLDLHALLGKGQLVITIEPDEGQRYQGIVGLDRETLAECLEGYFYQSEQLPTHLQLAMGGNQAAGFMVQRLPTRVSDEEQADEDWELIHALVTTLTPAELLALPAEQVLHRLFHEHDLQVFAERPVRYQCDCSRERSAHAIVALGQAEVEEVLQELERVVIDCQFCNSQYAFDKVDCHMLFSPGSASKGEQEILH
ncbi:MAG: Hsp33 family molecular chaperone HslO [Gammaproteobacteria bacterium]|nr:Hsp33 family molecular chaperone HslO [Gammaproteobacteria bacterium]MCP4879813.1 Hsp33 family molecular chaperone HslO [Gammaproteobacteria bacterium]